jgi:sugar lactone lactonase YvrE
MSPTRYDCELALDARAIHGEGTRWDADTRRLLWVDIAGRAVHVFDPATGEDRAVDVGQPVGAVAPRRHGVLAAIEQGFALVDLDTGAAEIVAATEGDLPGNRMNDGACDPAGRFWAGSMAYDERPGALYRLGADLAVVRVIDDVTIANGPTWSPDGTTMYFTDTPTRRIDAFDFDVSEGRASRRRPFTEVRGGGHPDGMTVDADGCVWSAQYGAGQVHRYTPDGVLDAIVEVPAHNTTCCAFGGDDLATLFITTAIRLRDQHPGDTHAGGVFACRPGVGGTGGAHHFAG